VYPNNKYGKGNWNKNYPTTNNKFLFKNKVESNDYPIEGKSIPAFQINRFKDIISLRFNEEFVNEILNLAKNTKPTEVVNGLLKDLEELVDSSNNECFVSDCYHVGKIGNCIYLQINNKCCSMLFDFFSSLSFFPSYILAFKQRLEKMNIQGKMHDSMSFEEEDCEEVY